MNTGTKRVDLNGIRFTDGITWVFDATATAPTAESTTQPADEQHAVGDLEDATE